MILAGSGTVIKIIGLRLNHYYVLLMSFGSVGIKKETFFIWF